MLVSADANTVFWYVAASLLLGRVGSALANPAINTTAIGALSAQQMRQGAGLTNLFLMFGGSTGISMYVIVLEYRTEFHASNLGATQNVANDTTVDMLGRVANQLSTSGLTDSLQQTVAMRYLDQVVTAQANMLGFQDGFFLLAMVALAPLIPVSVLLRKSARKSS